MKSFLGVSFTLIVLLAVVLGGGLLWYLSQSTEISRSIPESAPANLR